MEPMWILKGLGFLAIGIALFLLVTLIVMRLWNWLVPELFNGPKIRFVQALGLLFLTRLLVGGFNVSHSGHQGFNRNHATVCHADDKESDQSKADKFRKD